MAADKDEIHTKANWGARIFARVRSWATTHTRGLALANIGAQIGIIVTGGAVRLSGSGLGCSTWPQCEPGSFVPVAFDAAALHPQIEFGNRLLTFVLATIAGLLAIGVWYSRPDLRRWGLIPIVGIVLQGLVGGLTVLVELHPLVVAPHMLLSLLLVWISVQLALRLRSARRTPPKIVADLQWLLRSFAVVLIVLLVLGALTTGSGPHSGDLEATIRLNLDPAHISRLHALAVWGYIVLFGVLWWIAARGLKKSDDSAKTEVRRAAGVLLLVTLSQGAIGYIQYFSGLPELLVAAHLLGAGLLVAAHSALHYFLAVPRS